MVTSPGNPLQAHYGRYTPALYVVLAVMAVGVVCGVLAIGTLSVGDQLQLTDYVKRFVELQAHHPTYGPVFNLALRDNLKLVGLFYLFGVSVAGMPLVVVAVFFRGFVLGFTADFLVTSLHWAGALLGLITVGLVSLFLVPALIIAGAVALGFSWDLISPATRRHAPHLGRSFAFFTGLMIVMAAVTVVGTALEAYASPLFIHVLATWGV